MVSIKYKNVMITFVCRYCFVRVVIISFIHSFYTLIIFKTFYCVIDQSWVGLCWVILTLFVTAFIAELMFCFFYLIFDVYNDYCSSVVCFCNNYIISICQFFKCFFFLLLLDCCNICCYCYFAFLFLGHFWLLQCTFLRYGGFYLVSVFY